MSINNKVTLLDFAENVNKKLDVISTRVEGFDDVQNTLQDLVNQIHALVGAVLEIKMILNRAIDFMIGFLPKILYGFFIIIIIAMGLKEIPKFF